MTAAALWVLAVIAIVFFLRSASTLLIPIAIGLLLSYALEPLVARLERLHVPRVIGAAVTVLLALGVIAAGAYALRDDARQFVEAVPQAVERARETVRSYLGQLGAQDITRSAEGQGSAAPSLTQRVVSGVFTFAGNVVVVVFLIYFVLLAGDQFKRRVVEIAGRGDADRRRTTLAIIDDINSQIQRYLLVLLFTGAIVAASTWAVLAWMKVQQAAMWGILAGIFNSIPYVGPVIVAGGLFVVGLAQGGGVSQAIQMSGAAIVITSLEGWLITPPLMGKVERMSSLAVFIGLLFWTWVWGEWGTLLAVPMLVVIKTIADRVNRLKPVGRMLAR
ncbi:MAG TPA: AI-2E family transporter [Vicinamibacterales bacterium]|nr:AI-2E family transporter [Vicinamibacterales bacterium]